MADLLKAPTCRLLGSVMKSQIDKRTSKTGKVHIATFNGTPFVLKMIQDGDTVRMDIGENPAQVGYATIDQVGRVLTGAGPIASGDENIPLRIFTKVNVNEAGTPPMLGKAYASDFESGYLKLWGLSS